MLQLVLAFLVAKIAKPVLNKLTAKGVSLTPLISMEAVCLYVLQDTIKQMEPAFLVSNPAVSAQEDPFTNARLASKDPISSITDASKTALKGISDIHLVHHAELAPLLAETALLSHPVRPAKLTILSTL